MKNFKEALNAIRCFVFDVDGVLTNNTIVVMQNELHRIMNIRDGFALKEAVECKNQVSQPRNKRYLSRCAGQN